MLGNQWGALRANILSPIYRYKRRKKIDEVYARQEREGRLKNLEEAIEEGDKILKNMASDIGSSFLFDFPIPKNIGVNLYDLYFPSPIILSSFKDDVDVLKAWSRLGLGGVIFKTPMELARGGNNEPRIVELPGGDLLNAMGLPGQMINTKANKIITSGLFDKPAGISLGGSSLGEYIRNFDLLNRYITEAGITKFFWEINISCPNTPDGQNMLKNPELLENLLDYMIKRTKNVIGVKLSPDQSDDDLIKFSEMIFSKMKPDTPGTYVNLGNTKKTPRTAYNLGDAQFTMEYGGKSGPSLYNRTLGMTRLITKKVPGLSIISTGGVSSANNVKELLDAGATLVGTTTGIVKDMYWIPKANYQLARRAS